MNMLLRSIAVLAATATVAGCNAATAPTPALDSVTTSASAPAVQAAALGATLTVTDAGGTAAYTVGNLRPVPAQAQIIPAKGAMWAVDVTIAAQSGTVTYNGFYFVGKTQDGSNVAPAVGAVKPGITSGQLDQGQSLDGHVAFDIAPGQSISQVTLRDPKGKTLAVWGVA